MTFVHFLSTENRLMSVCPKKMLSLLGILSRYLNPPSLYVLGCTSESYRLAVTRIVESAIYWKIQTGCLIGNQLPDHEGSSNKGKLTWKEVHMLFHRKTYMTRSYTAHLFVTYCRLSQEDLEHAFQASVIRGHTKIVKTLIQEGVNPSIMNDLAITIASDKGHLKIVRLLLQDERVNPRHEQLDCMLRTAAMKGHLKIMKLLVRCRGLNTRVDWGGLLIEAATGGRIKLIQYLLSAHVTDVQTEHRYCAITQACGRGHTDALKMLLPLVQVDILSMTYNNSSYLASRAGRTEILRILLDRLSRMGIQKDMSIELTTAAERGHYECVKLLLESSNCNITMHCGYDALTQAMWRGREAVVRLLLTDPRTATRTICDDVRKRARDLGCGRCVDIIEDFYTRNA